MSSYWLEDPHSEVARMSQPIAGRVDVAVVGGGVTGCACAHVLAGAGLRVRLHEAREIASGASGRNGGFALWGGALPYDTARERLGSGRAREVWGRHGPSRRSTARAAGGAVRPTGRLTP